MWHNAPQLIAVLGETQMALQDHSRWT